MSDVNITGARALSRGASQLDRWQADFGKDYTDRNVVDWHTRVEGFKRMIPTGVYSVLEIGCNRGHNLRALREAFPAMFLAGFEPNTYALDIARRELAAKYVYLGERSVYEVSTWGDDLVFTSGVLIHIPPDRLNEALTNIYKASHKYVLAIEYEGNDETVHYRGHDDMLWKRDFGAHYQRLFPKMELVDKGANVPGFNGATYWLLKK